MFCVDAKQTPWENVITPFLAMYFDLHVHTARGSGDSSLSPQELLDEASRIGLDGVCLTEHNKTWEHSDLRWFSERNSNLLVVRAMEVETDMGHVTVFGLDGYVPGIWSAYELRRVADKHGAFLVSAHPFRGIFTPQFKTNNLLFRDWSALPETAQEAAEHPIFSLVDAIEGLNGGNTDRENSFAISVSRYLGKPTVGGSDAHSHHGLGACVTAFRDSINTEKEFLELLRSGNYYPVQGLRQGNPQPMS
jgi:hypothetical protein